MLAWVVFFYRTDSQNLHNSAPTTRLSVFVSVGQLNVALTCSTEKPNYTGHAELDLTLPKNQKDELCPSHSLKACVHLQACDTIIQLKAGVSNLWPMGQNHPTADGFGKCEGGHRFWTLNCVSDENLLRDHQSNKVTE